MTDIIFTHDRLYGKVSAVANWIATIENKVYAVYETRGNKSIFNGLRFVDEADAVAFRLKFGI
jgi:hypothetical protein